MTSTRFFKSVYSEKKGKEDELSHAIRCVKGIVNELMTNNDRPMNTGDAQSLPLNTDGVIGFCERILEEETSMDLILDGDSGREGGQNILPNQLSNTNDPITNYNPLEGTSNQESKGESTQPKPGVSNQESKGKSLQFKPIAAKKSIETRQQQQQQKQQQQQQRQKKGEIKKHGALYLLSREAKEEYNNEGKIYHSDLSDTDSNPSDIDSDTSSYANSDTTPDSTEESSGDETEESSGDETEEAEEGEEEEEEEEGEEEEAGCAERYVEKGYEGGFDHKNGPWVAVHPQASDTSSYAPKY